MDHFCQPGSKLLKTQAHAPPFFATTPSCVTSILQPQHSDTSMAGPSKPTLPLGPQLIAHPRPISLRIILLSPFFSPPNCKDSRRQLEAVSPHMYIQPQHSWAAKPVYYLRKRIWFSLSLHLFCLPVIRWAPGLSLHCINSAGMCPVPAAWRRLTCVEYIYCISGL